MIFGSRAEKFVTADTNNDVVQADLFPDDKLGQMDVVKTALVKAHQKPQTKLIVNHPSLNPLPESLRREVIALMPGEDVVGLQPVGKEITEILEYQPGELYVKRFERPEYIKPSADGLSAGRVIAALPKLPLEKSIAGSSLLTHLLVNKFVDHLPLDRQLEIFKRQNVTINHSTVSGWTKDAMALVKPVYYLHCSEILNTNYLFAGSHERAQDAAMLYSQFATCRLHNINPEHWLTNLFNQINCTEKENLHQLLPQNYPANFTQQ